MTTVANSEVETMEDFLARLGDIPPGRVLMRPAPGEATEADLLEQLKHRRICELVDGTLVEKAMGFEESSLTVWLSYLLYDGIGDRDLGKLSGESGMMRLGSGLVRAPDLSFTRWSKFPQGQRSAGPIADLVPDLAIEVLSASNTPGEIARKIGEYFSAGTELVWIVDPVRRVVVVHTAPATRTTLTEADTLDGADVLPGVRFPVSRVFQKTPAVAKKRARRKRGDSQG
jgi:Uma2 family endonuclease